MFRLLFLLITAGVAAAQNVPQLQNAEFESSARDGSSIPGWEVSFENNAMAKETQVLLKPGEGRLGSQALLIATKGPQDVKVSQELFLPVGTLWRVSAWSKIESVGNEQTEAGALEVETPVGDQGKAAFTTGMKDWTHGEVVFRVPSPGRVRIALHSESSGKHWFDDVSLQAVNIAQATDVHIQGTKISKRPIDVKQGGQFIEPLCHMIPSMLAQQVEADSFEEETPCEPSYKQGMDWPKRPWYPDGAVHVATFSYDSSTPFNGKRSQKIVLPIARARAGISQDGFYLTEGTGYKLRLHMRGIGAIRVSASLRADGVLVAGPILLGETGAEWQGAEAVLRPNRTTSNATLTIEFEGPGTLWLDRIYLIAEDAVLGLWRPDVVAALKAMNPGIVRFGGSMIEDYEWDRSIGPWDSRIPFKTGVWGGQDPNFVGVEEFVQLARYVGAEPLICVRWTGKTPADAAAEVEYLNGGADSKWGRLRAQNGHPQPYQVKYWQIGNEVGGTEYDGSVRSFAEAMRKVDPSIKILSSFPSTQTLSRGEGYLDYLCPHHYEVADLPLEQGNLEFLKDQIAQHGEKRDVRVAVTEWNTTAGDMGLTRGMLLTLGNALSASRYQNLLHRYADLVEIAVRSNLSDSFGSGVIQPGQGWIYLTPTYYSQILYQRAAGTFPLKIERPSNLAWALQDPDLSATLSSDGRMLRVYAVNSTADFENVHFYLDALPLPIAGGEITVLKDRENVGDSEAMNSRNDPERIISSSLPLDLTGTDFPMSFAPFSVTLLELRLGSLQHSPDGH